jgi:2-furoyl-CoA dehydrogenase large subunit
VHGATVHAIGAALHETFRLRRVRQLLTANFYDYHVPHALDLPEIKTGHIESPSPFSSLGTKGMGEGGGAAIHAICAAIQDALRAAGSRRLSTTRSTRPSGSGACSRPRRRRRHSWR